MKNSARPSLSTITPPKAVPFPLVYLLVEWTTTSTPHEIGLNKVAVATVLSQIVIIPYFFATSTIFSIAGIAIWGFDNDSMKIPFVLSSTKLSKSLASSLLKVFTLIPKVKKVSYPGLKGDKYYDKAQKYFKNGLASGLISFEVSSFEEAKKVIDSAKLFSIVVNIGDSKSLIVHPASTTHSQMNEEDLLKAGVTPVTVRLSIGLEDSADLIEDLNQALNK